METSNAFFKVKKGLGNQTEIPIADKTFITAGNSNGVDLKLANQFVSRRHFRLHFETDVFYISDLDSTNGTYLNGKKLESNVDHVLRNGDEVGLGVDRVLLIFTGTHKTMYDTVRINESAVVENTSEKNLTTIKVESGSREVLVRGNKIVPPLPKKEFDILEYLFLQRGNSVSRDMIAQVGWPERPDDVANDEIDQYIRRLRIKVEIDPSKPTIIITRRGYGYMLT